MNKALLKMLNSVRTWLPMQMHEHASYVVLNAEITCRAFIIGVSSLLLTLRSLPFLYANNETLTRLTNIYLNWQCVPLIEANAQLEEVHKFNEPRRKFLVFSL